MTWVDTVRSEQSGEIRFVFFLFFLIAVVFAETVTVEPFNSNDDDERSSWIVTRNDGAHQRDKMVLVKTNVNGILRIRICLFAVICVHSTRHPNDACCSKGPVYERN